MTAPYLLGIYEDDELTLEAVKHLKASGVHVDDVFSPFPIHGIDPILGLKESRLPTVAFLFGAVGLVSAIGLQVYTMGIDWPINIGGKPALPFPSFIPVSFELTVLFASLGMVGTYLYRMQLKPGVERELADIRQTDDRFVVAIKIEGKSEKELQKARAVLAETNPLEIREKAISDDYELKDDFTRDSH